MSPVYALAAGALLGALLGLPYGFLGLLTLPLLPRGSRGYGALGLLLVLLSLALHPDPWAGQLGKRGVLEGGYRNGILHTPKGPIYPELYPRPDAGRLRVSGRVARPKPPRNPGAFDLPGWLRGKGVTAVLEDARVRAHRPESGLRARAQARLAEGLSPAAARLARALVLGDRSALAGDEKAAFRRAGLAHLLALSGLHVGILVGFFLLLLYPLGRGRYLLALALTLGYLALVGPSPSLVRATLMAGVLLLLLFSGRGTAGAGPALALALALQLALTPHAVFDLGFRLSYLAVLGLLVFLPPLMAPLGGVPRALRYLLGAALATLAAQAATLPLLLDAFHEVPLLSPLANLLALPLVTLFVPLGFLKLLGAAFLAPALNLLGSGLLEIAGRFASGPKLTWGAIGPAGFSLYYLALLALALGLYRRLSRLRAALLIALAVLLSLLPRAFPVLEVWQLDVGEGHATLIRAPGGVEVLLDAGPPWAEGRVRRALSALGVDELDLLVLSHPDRDHAGAAPGLLASVPVGAVLTSRFYPEEDPALQAAREGNVRHLAAGYGDRVRLGPLVLEVWNPPPAAPPEENARSLVVRVRWQGRAVLVLGDLPKRLEDGLPPLPADVLVASHHGAENGTGERVLEQTRPRVVLVGVGKNPFGHPSPKTLRRIQAAGARAFRTDLSGAVRVRLSP